LQKNEARFLSLSIYKDQLKWINNVYVGLETTRRNEGEMPQDIGVGKEFF
jgi:hypothetical protein